MKIDFDEDSNALYFYFKELGEGEVEETREISSGIYLDIDKNNNPIGVEILGVNSSLALSDLDNILKFLLTLRHFYSISEVAHLLNVNDETIRRKVKKGEIIAKKIGGRAGYRIETSEIKKFLLSKA